METSARPPAGVVSDTAEMDADASGLAPRRVRCETRADGSILFTSQVSLPAYRARQIDHLFLWAAREADRALLYQKRDDAWRRLTFGEAALAVRRIGAALLALGVTQERPLAVLSGNSIEHALIGFAAQAVGVPCAPISVPYSLADKTLGKLRHILAKLTPGLIFVDQAAPFAERSRFRRPRRRMSMPATRRASCTSSW